MGGDGRTRRVAPLSGPVASSSRIAPGIEDGRGRLTSEIPLFKMTIVGPLPWGSSGHHESWGPREQLQDLS